MSQPGNTDPYVVWLDDPAAAARQLLGGKFAGLAEMMAAGFAVPPGFAITTAAYRRFMVENGLDGVVEQARSVAAGDLEALEQQSRRISEAIAHAQLPGEVADAVREAHLRLERDAQTDTPPVAVRSSGLAEDLQGASYAGQYETYLWIMGIEEVLARVKDCWSGLFSARVLSYHAHGEAPSALPSMAVGVQQMIAARAAGVMFTLDPVTGDRSKVVIEAAWGLGEAVVAGEVTPDRYRVDKVALQVLASEISAKEIEYGFNRDTRAVEARPVPEHRRAASSLTDEQVLELAKLAKRIERHRGAPMDIEWALDAAERVHVLQVRPETVWSQKRREPIAPEADSAVQRVLARFMAGAGTPATPRQDGRK